MRPNRLRWLAQGNNAFHGRRAFHVKVTVLVAERKTRRQVAIGAHGANGEHRGIRVDVLVVVRSISDSETSVPSSLGRAEARRRASQKQARSSLRRGVAKGIEGLKSGDLAAFGS